MHCRSFGKFEPDGVGGGGGSVGRDAADGKPAGSFGANLGSRLYGRGTNFGRGLTGGLEDGLIRTDWSDPTGLR